MLPYKHSNLFVHLWNNRFLTPDCFVHNIVSFFLLMGVQAPKRPKVVGLQKKYPHTFLTFTVLKVMFLH